jgi:hypothetical protein
MVFSFAFASENSDKPTHKCYGLFLYFPILAFRKISKNLHIHFSSYLYLQVICILIYKININNNFLYFNMSNKYYIIKTLTNNKKIYYYVILENKKKRNNY